MDSTPVNSSSPLRGSSAHDRASLPPRPPPIISDHELLRRIGRGSYGEVWLARNVMGAYRAVKVVCRDAFRDQRPFERELAGIRKYEPISRSHEGFIDVLHVGQDGQAGYFYYVMELGDDLRSGQSIDPASYVAKTLAKQLSAQKRLPPEECLQLGLSLSSALTHLHKQGLVHRDIKPSNIIFVGGIPKLADMGLVAEIDEARSYVGTEGFIPPEGPGSPRADVYGLGKVLYEASTGLDRHEFPALPDDLAEFADPGQLVELNEVLLQACRANPQERYPSAWKMHADLVVLANGRSVRRLRTLERRWSRAKHAGALVAVAALVMGAIAFQTARELRIASEKKQREVGGKIAHGTEMMERRDLLGALGTYAEALALDQGSPQRESTHRMQLMAVLEQCPRLVQMWFSPSPIRESWFSPDGQKVLMVESCGKAQVFDLASAAPASPAFGRGKELYRAAFSPDTSLAVTADLINVACVWEVTTGHRRLSLPHPGAVFSAKFSPDGIHVLTACEDGYARIWDAQSGRELREMHAHQEAILYATFSPGGKLVATTSRDGSARLWDAATGEPVGPPLGHDNWVGYASFSPDGKRLVTAGFDHRARVWEVGTGRKLLPDLLHRDGVVSAEFSPDGRLIVTACLDGLARVWAADTAQPFDRSPTLRHSDRLQHASFSPDGHRIVTSCLDGTVRVWDLAGSGLAPMKIEGCLSEDGAVSVTASDGSLQIVEIASGRTARIKTDDPALEFKLNPDGRFLITTGRQVHSGAPALEVRSAPTGELVGRAVPYAGSLTNAVLSDDGSRLALIDTHVVRIHEVTAGRGPTASLPHAQAVSGALFRPDGRQLATWSETNLFLWDAVSGRLRAGPFGLASPIRCVQFSRAGRYLGVGCADIQLNRCSARIWETMTGTVIGKPLQHGDGVLSIAFSPDGNRVVTASEDFTAMVWETATGKQLTPPLRHGHQVQDACFSPDGGWVATASTDQTARVWDAETGDPLTPPLRAPTSLWHASFDRQGTQLIALDSSRHGFAWALHVDRRPVDQWLDLATLLSGQNGSPAVLQATWQRIQGFFPAAVTLADQELAAWHSEQAESSQKEEDWRAAVFHLKRLLSLSAEDDPAKSRLAKALGRLQGQNDRELR